MTLSSFKAEKNCFHEMFVRASIVRNVKNPHPTLRKEMMHFSCITDSALGNTYQTIETQFESKNHPKAIILDRAIIHIGSPLKCLFDRSIYASMFPMFSFKKPTSRWTLE